MMMGTVTPHPRPNPRISKPLSPQNIRTVFLDCVDFLEQPILLGGDPHKKVILFSIIGMVRNERINDFVLRPLGSSALLKNASFDGAFSAMLTGTIYNFGPIVIRDMDQAVTELVKGSVLIAFPDRSEMIAFPVVTEEKRAVSDPENEPAMKGAKDSFVETIRTNTSLVRRRFRSPDLKIKEQIVGRQTLTPVDILYIEGITNPQLVKEAEERIRNIDIDALLSTGNLEEYIIDEVDTAFPLISYTERPDRFCAGLVEGRVGILADGIPLGYLLPGTMGEFLKTADDKSRNWMAASVLSILRYICMFTTLFLPALYIAAVTFHPEMLPAQLAWSIVEAKRNVPFGTVFEVLILLIAFEVVQEAGLRLPAPIGQTVSILGGLVVGTAAVEAKIVSPAVLIVVAVAGIAGYTMPSQEFSGALRIWRFLLAISAGLSGVFGAILVGAALVYRLAALESFGVPYLTPFAAAMGKDTTVIRWPMPWQKFRERALKTTNKRRQR
ncbi:MAG: spore germination protein [Evtepia sp.]